MKVAVCDDNKSMLDFISKQISKDLEDNGITCEISSFLNGKEFITQHEKTQFDIVFLDIKMSDIDGFTVAKELRNSSDNTQIIFVTTEDVLVYDSFNYQPF